MNDLDLHAIYRDTLSARISDVHERTLNALAPIYTRAADGAPELIGTGVIIGTEQRRFLFSAAHVGADTKNEKIFCGLGSELLRVPTQVFKSVEQTDNPFAEFDLKFWELPPEYRTKIPAAGYIDVRECDLHGAAPKYRGEDSVFVIIGYPKSKQPRRPKPSGELGVLSFALLCRPYTKEVIESSSIVEGENVILEYVKDDVYTMAGRTVGPNLHGVSGGAVWFYPGFALPESGKPLLSGIAISWRKQTPEGVRVTPIRFALAGILAVLEKQLPV